jgi:hypothetical protein
MSASPSDEQHIQLLPIFHYVVGGMTALFACMPLIHLGIGIAVCSECEPNKTLVPEEHS